MEREPIHYKIILKSHKYEKNLVDFLKINSIEFKKINYFENYSIYKIPIIDEEKIKDIKSQSFVKRIEKMYFYFLNFGSKVVQKKFNFIDKAREQNKADIGIIDNGISPIDALKPWIVKSKIEVCNEKRAMTHGTFVAGVITYGDELNDSKWVDGEPLKILDGCIVPDFNVVQLEEDEFLLRMIKIVENNPEIRVWNLSLSIRHPVDPHFISDFGKVIDYLQEKYNILICKSAGNGDFSGIGRQKEMILQGADSVRAFVVASCDNNKNVSNFSRTGFGHEFLIKPDIAMCGGNVYFLEKKRVEPVISFGVDGNIVESIGSSFATARVSAIAGNILKKLKNISILQLKAMILLNTSNEDLFYTGYGCVNNVKDIFKEFNNKNVVNGNIGENNIKLKIPFDNYTLKFLVTSDVLVDYEEKNEYITDYIEVILPSDLDHKNKYEAFIRRNPNKKYEIKMDGEKGEILIEIRKKGSSKKKIGYCIIF